MKIKTTDNEVLSMRETQSFNTNIKCKKFLVINYGF